MKKNRIIYLIVIVGVIGLLTFGFMLGSEEKEVVVEEEKTYSVETIKVNLTSEQNYIEYAALIKNQDIEQVMFDTVATINKIYVEEGDYVNKGQLIMTLDGDNADTQIEQAENALNTASSNRKTAESNLDLAQKRYDAEIANQENDNNSVTIKQNLDDSTLKKDTKQQEYDVEKAKVDELNGQMEMLDSEIATLEASKTALVEQKSQIESNEALTEEEKQSQIEAINVEIGTLDTSIAEKNKQKENINTELTEANLTLQTKQTELQTATLEYNAALAAYEANIREQDITLSTLQNSLDTAKNVYDSSISAEETAQKAYDRSIENKNELNYYAKNSGQVISIITEEGGVSTPLAPVLVIGSDNYVAEFGVSQDDVDDVKVGNFALVTKDGQTFNGEVLNTSVIPDEASRTYLTNVLIEDDNIDFLLGELVDVKVYIEEVDGIFIPINIVLNDGEDYVYVVEDNRAVRKNIQIIGLNDNQVMVSGLDNNDEVVSMGMKNIKSGSLLRVVN